MTPYNLNFSDTFYFRFFTAVIRLLAIFRLFELESTLNGLFYRVYKIGSTKIKKISTNMRKFLEYSLAEITMTLKLFNPKWRY